MNIFRLAAIAFFIHISVVSFAQICWLKPENPKVTDTVTLYFNAAEGNRALADQPGDVYIHTGVITNKSIDAHDWKYVIGNWGKDDQSLKMKREGKNLYSFRFVINSFYMLRPEDVVNQLVYVFRNMDGSLVGKTKDNEDITVAVNGYKPPVKAVTESNREIHKLRHPLYPRRRHLCVLPHPRKRKTVGNGDYE